LRKDKKTRELKYHALKNNKVWKKKAKKKGPPARNQDGFTPFKPIQQIQAPN